MESATNGRNTTSSIAFSNNTSKCPKCGGVGYVLWRTVTDRSREVYGDDRAVDYAFDCPTCNGGHVEKIAMAKKFADIPQAFYDKRLDAFNWDIYKDSEGKKIDLTKQKQFVESLINDYQEWETDGIGFYIWSRTKGSGKTFLASCICNELMNKYAMRTKFVSANNLINIAQSADKDAVEEYKRDPIALLCNCKFLVIDDLGQKNSGTEWLSDILFRITDDRMQKKLVTIVTSNINLQELNIDDRIADRIQKMCQPIPLPECCVRVREGNDIKRGLFSRLGLI